VTWRVVLAAALLAAAPGCAGRSCDDLPSLRAERDRAREAYLALARSDASPAQTEQADADLHALERRVHDVEQDCGR
jgi:hypothetical protein